MILLGFIHHFMTGSMEIWTCCCSVRVYFQGLNCFCILTSRHISRPVCGCPLCLLLDTQTQADAVWLLSSPDQDQTGVDPGYDRGNSNELPGPVTSLPVRVSQVAWTPQQWAESLTSLTRTVWASRRWSWSRWWWTESTCWWTWRNVWRPERASTTSCPSRSELCHSNL